MKTHYLLFSLFLCSCMLFCNCSKEKEEPQIPIPTPVKTKYLHKIYWISDTHEDRIEEQYIWNDQKQLAQIVFLGSHTHRFTYNKDNDLDSVYYSSYFGKYTGKFYYNESNQIYKMEYKKLYDSDYEQASPHRVEYTYKTGSNKLDHSNFILANGQSSLISFEWENDNISYLSDNVYGRNLNFYSYDSCINPYRFFPQVILPYFAEDAYWAIIHIVSSKNNYVLVNWGGNNIEYKYDYDTDGYPIFRYIKQNGEWVKDRKYEYLPE